MNAVLFNFLSIADKSGKGFLYKGHSGIDVQTPKD